MTDDVTTDETENAEAADQHDGDGKDPLTKVRREAANYRRKLREVEAERDTLRADLTATRRGQVEEALSDHLADPADLLTDDVDVSGFFTEGKLDPAAVNAAAAGALQEHPHWAPRETPDFDGGARGPVPTDQPPSFGQALKNAV